jgi:tRNA dimethylallyltransferase
MSSKKPLLICVVGPTAIGKTSLSIELARAFSAEIISADSRQFFKEMNIGTAVPSSEELLAAPHHFIQHKSINEHYTVGEFEREALSKIAELSKDQEIIIMVGGSGLYVDAVVEGLDRFPEIKEGVREALNLELDALGIAPLQEELKKVDAAYYHKIDNENPRRLIRALEVYRSSGAPYSSFLRKHETVRPFNTLYVGLTAERPVVYDRINRRVDIMMAEGLLNEAKELLAHRSLNALQTVGYRELFQYFDGNYTLDEAVSEIKKNTRRFAKRQGTWFRKNEEIQWFDYETTPEEIITYIKAKNAL